MATSKLLSLLADGEFRSGQDLAHALGVSRTAVWKQLNKVAREAGIEVQSQRGRGYRIPGGLDLLDAAQVRAGLEPAAANLLTDLLLLDRTDSTNAELLRRAADGGQSGLVCTAESQSAGRGRRGRDWVSPYAGNIYLSLLWRFGQGAAALEGMSLAVGVAVARALARCGVTDTQLKWPNDVLHGDRKLGGILLEMTGDADGPCQVVIGVGLNVRMPSAAAAAIDQPWTDLTAAAGGGSPGRNTVLAALLNELLPLAAEFESVGFAPWRDAWLALDAYAGRPVVIDTGANRLVGSAQGVDERGALRLDTGSGVQLLHGGEISLRPDT